MRSILFCVEVVSITNADLMNTITRDSLDDNDDVLSFVISCARRFHVLRQLSTVTCPSVLESNLLILVKQTGNRNASKMSLCRNASAVLLQRTHATSPFTQFLLGSVFLVNTLSHYPRQSNTWQDGKSKDKIGPKEVSSQPINSPARQTDIYKAQ